MFVIVALIGPLIAPYGPFEVVLDCPGRASRAVAAGSVANWLGTTNQGMDVFSQLL